MRMTSGQQSATPLHAVGRVGLWGAPGSGKTTFLAALSIATHRSPSDGLMLFGANDASTDFLIRHTARLTEDREFPPPTVRGEQLSWVMHMPARVPVRRFGITTTTTVPFRFSLDLLDEPGRAFRDVSADEGSAMTSQATAARLGFADDDAAAHSAVAVRETEDTFIDQLTDCDGLLLLFDPVREWREGDAFNYFHGTLMKIAQRVLSGARPGAKLPQYVAVCTTKFDSPDVYRRAADRGYRNFSPTDPHLFPRISDTLAERFFVDMVNESQRGNADLVRNALRHYFAGDRVKFFVSSAIGFYLDRQVNKFQEHEFNNVDEPGGGAPRIRGAIYPINVVEPLLWLGENLAARK